MSDLGFSHEEKSLVLGIANDRNGVGSRLGFYASVLVPVSGFACYGIAQRDFLALTLGFIGLSIFVVWRISRELSILATYRALFAKVAAHERKVSE